MSGQPQEFCVQLVVRFREVQIQRDAVDGTNLAALRFCEMPDAFGAPVRIDLVDLLALKDRIVRALGLTDVAINTLVRNLERHRGNPCVTVLL